MKWFAGTWVGLRAKRRERERGTFILIAVLLSGLTISNHLWHYEIAPPMAWQIRWLCEHRSTARLLSRFISPCLILSLPLSPYPCLSAALPIYMFCPIELPGQVSPVFLVTAIFCRGHHSTTQTPISLHTTKGANTHGAFVRHGTNADPEPYLQLLTDRQISIAYHTR